MARLTKAAKVKLGKLLSKMTPKQRELTKQTLENPDATVAERGAASGFATKVKRGVVVSPGAQKALASKAVRSAIELALDAAGADLASAAKVVAQAQQANETKFYAFEGRVVDKRVVVDHPTRLAAAKLNLEARKVVGGGAAGQGGPTFNVFSKLTTIQIAQIADGKASLADFAKDP